MPKQILARSGVFRAALGRFLPPGGEGTSPVKRRSSIQSRLIKDFSIAILIPALVTAIVGGRMLRERVFVQAQAQVNSDLEAARVMYQQHLERLKDAIRIHSSRMVIYGALTRGDKTGLVEEMQRILKAERLDILEPDRHAGACFLPDTESGPVGR